MAREEIMARSTKAKSSKRKQAKPKTGLLAAANVSGIGDFETFTLIREMHDRLAEQGGDAQAAKRARPSMAAASVVPDSASDSPWISLARGELGQRDYPGPRYNPRVVEYLNTTGLQGNDDETSWCKGHVGFFDGWDVGNRVRLLGGNQGGGVSWDEVCVANFPQERVLGYRWPLSR